LLQRLIDGLQDFLERIGVARQCRDAVSLLCKGLDETRANPSPNACDNCDFIVRHFHSSFCIA